MVSVHRARVVVHFNYDVVLLWEGGRLVGCYLGRYLGRSDALALRTHVSILRFLQFWEMLGYILDVDEGPCGIVAASDGLEPSRLDGVSGCCVEVSYGLFNAGKFIHIVDGLIVNTLDRCLEMLSDHCKLNPSYQPP